MPPVSANATNAIDINALLEFSRLLNQSDDPDRIYGTVLLSLMGKLRLSRAAVALPVGDGSGLFRVEHTRGNTRGLHGVTFRWTGTAQEPLCGVDTPFVVDASADLRQEGIRYLVPICFADRTFAVILLGGPLLSETLGDMEENYAVLIGAITATAVEGADVRRSLREMNRKLERRVRRLHSVAESGRTFAGLLEGNEIVRLLGYTLMGEMTLARFALYLREGLGYHAAVNRFREEAPTETLLILQGKGPQLIDADAWPKLYEMGVRAAIPLKSQGETEGVMLVGERLQYGIDEEDLEYLGALGGPAIASLENARLLEEMIEKRRLEEDLRIAWEIQQQLLPSSLPKVPGYGMAAGTLPARQVGGDCYDVITLPDGRLLIAIADVSGKGTPASLLMANVQAALRALAPLGMPLGELAGRVNDLIHDNTAPDKFITAFLAILEPESGLLQYVNAGHNPPYHLSDGTIRGLTEGGLILGIMPTAIPYDVGAIVMAPGDLLAIYTDGVSEAMNPNREEYGDERLTRLLLAESGADASQLFERIRSDVETFVDGAGRSDDITIITLTRQE